MKYFYIQILNKEITISKVIFSTTEGCIYREKLKGRGGESPSLDLQPEDQSGVSTTTWSLRSAKPEDAWVTEITEST